jgi:hypothetical protein
VYDKFPKFFAVFRVVIDWNSSIMLYSGYIIFKYNMANDTFWWSFLSSFSKTNKLRLSFSLARCLNIGIYSWNVELLWITHQRTYLRQPGTQSSFCDLSRLTLYSKIWQKSVILKNNYFSPGYLCFVGEDQSIVDMLCLAFWNWLLSEILKNY